MSDPEHTAAREADDADEEDLLELVDELDENPAAEGSIVSSSTVHDRLQFESIFDFDLTPSGEDPTRRYRIDFFMFLPRSMGISSETYSREHFYTDLTNYLRIKTPKLRKTVTTRSSEDLSIPAADRYLGGHVSTPRRQGMVGKVVQDVKLFGCSMNQALRQLQSNLSRAAKPQAGKRLQQVLGLIDARLARLHGALAAYRKRYVARLKDRPVQIDQEVERAIFLVDEFLSYRLESVGIGLRNLVEKRGLEASELTRHIDRILESEAAYRHEAKLITLESGKDRATRLEQYSYRLGLLKKYVSEVMFIETDVIRKDRQYRNLVAGFCAGLAAAWWTLAELQRIQLARGITGTRLLIFVVLGIVAYIFKDRIKEVSKDYFNEKIKHFLPDFELRMAYSHVGEDGLGRRYPLGVSRDVMRYLPKRSVPPEVQYIRELSNRTALDPERNDVILHYSKNVTFNLEPFRDGLEHVRCVKNVLRFDIGEFLGKLDDPNKTLRFYDPQEGISKAEAPKVYHINVVFRYGIDRHDEKTGKLQRRIECERLRIIVNKKGIVRVETVLPRGELSYVEDSRA